MYRIPRNVYIIVEFKNIYVYMFKTITCLHFCDKRAFVIYNLTNITVLRVAYKLCNVHVSVHNKKKTC